LAPSRLRVPPAANALTAQGMSRSAFSPVDWHSPLPEIVSALVSIAPRPGLLAGDEECEALDKLRAALAAADAELRRRAGGRRSGRNFEALPQTVLEQIFAYALGNAPRCVACRWRSAAWRLRLPRRLSSSLKVFRPGRRVTATELVALLQSLPEIHHCKLGTAEGWKIPFYWVNTLQLPAGVQLGKKSAEVICRVLPWLRDVDLGFSSSARCKADAFLILSEGLRHLRSLRMSSRIQDSMTVTPAVFIQGSSHLQGLVELRLEIGGQGHLCWSDDDLVKLACACPLLERFALHYDGRTYDWSKDQLFGPALEKLLEVCRGLQRLELGLTTRLGLRFFRFVADRAASLRLQSLHIYGAVALETRAGAGVRARLESVLGNRFSTSEEQHRKLLRDILEGRGSVFVPSMEYLCGLGITTGGD